MKAFLLGLAFLVIGAIAVLAAVQEPPWFVVVSMLFMRFWTLLLGVLAVAVGMLLMMGAR